MRTLADFYLSLPKKYFNHPSFASRIGTGVYNFKSYSELISDSFDLAFGLEQIVPKHSKIAIFADNCYEWMTISVATTLLGGADVPRASDVTDQDIVYILNHSESKILFVENRELAQKILKLSDVLEFLKEIIIIHKSKETEKHKTEFLPKGNSIPVRDFQEVVTEGKKNRTNRNIDEFVKSRSVSETDLFTLIYTSGTTGKPKGVMLTHENILFQLRNLPIHLAPGDRTISILPIWHIFERIFEIFSMFYGACTYYSSVRTLKEDLKNVKPRFLASAPRLWESIYAGIQANILKSSGVKQALYKFSYYFAENFYESISVLKNLDLQLAKQNRFHRFFKILYHSLRMLLLLLPYLVGDFLVLSKIRQATGGKLIGSVSGGGALPLYVDRFFNTIGIPVLEGYGMTETSPVIAMRTFEFIIPGTVGKIFPQTEIRLVDIQTGEIFLDTSKNLIEFNRKGEIHVKGKQVMMGYYKDSANTNKILLDGWLNTGDLGVYTANEALQIVGRSKETIVLLGGENVEPIPIESKILESDWIDQCMVVGQDQKFLSVLIYPNLNLLTPEETLEFWKDKKLKQKIESEIKSKVNLNTGFKSIERVVGVIVIPKPFEVGDELTAKLSLKRFVITEKYSESIKSIYSS